MERDLGGLVSSGEVLSPTCECPGAKAVPFWIPDGFSHHHPFAFNLPLEFHDVGLYAVIIGDGDSDFAHVDCAVQMVTLDQV